MTRLRIILILLAVVLPGLDLRAHDPGLSSAQLSRRGSEVEVQLALAWSDFASTISSTLGSARLDKAQLARLGASLAKSLNDGVVDLRVGDVVLKPAALNITAGVASPTEVLVGLRWSNVPEGILRVEFPLLAKMPFGHRMLLTLDRDSSPVGLLDARHPVWKLLPPATTQSALASVQSANSPTVPSDSWLSFVFLGVEHILTGFDHLCFLLALLLVAMRFRDVLGVVTTFTVAHSLTLAAAAFGAVKISSSIVEPLIALSIIYIGMENIFLRRQPKHRLALVFGFGLIHGLGFASALAERLPGVNGFAVVSPLLEFNAGVELGQLMVAACLVPLIRLARMRPAFSGRMQPACSLMIAGAGIVWLVQRV